MRRNHKLVRAIVGATPVVALAAMSGRASATTLIYEPFNYSVPQPITGQVDTGNGSQHDETWLRAGTVGTTVHQIATGTVTMPPGLRSAVGNMADLKQSDVTEMEKLNLPPASGTAATTSYGAGSTLYYSMLLNVPTTTGLTVVNSNANANNDVIAAFNSASGSQAGRPNTWNGELVIKQGANGTFDLGIRGSNTTNNATYFTGDLTAGTSYFIVVSASLATTLTGNAADGTNTIWVNPLSTTYGAASAPTANTTNALYGGSSNGVGGSGTNEPMASLILGAGIATGATPNDVYVDELRVGTTWGDVTPSPTLYFDVNGGTAGSGVAAGLTYNWEDANWATDGQGGNGSNSWNSTQNAAVFAADQDSGGNYTAPNTNAYTVNLNSNETCNGLIVGEGTVTFSGVGSLTVSNGIINVATGKTTGGTAFSATAIINNNLNLGTNFIKTGGGLLILNGTASYSGTTTISGGVLQIGTGGTTGSIPAASVITNSGAIVFDHSDNLTQGAGGQFDTTGAGISGSGNVVQAGSGNLTLAVANTYKGVTKATAGTLTVMHTLAVQNSIVQTGAGGAITFDSSLGGLTVTIGGLSSMKQNSDGSFSDTGVAYNGPVMNLLINSVSTNSTAPTIYSATISGGTSITKQGSNPQTFGATNNSYSGATTVSVGSLGFTNTGAMSPNSAITVTGTSDWTIPNPVVNSVGPQGQTANFTGGILTAYVTTSGTGNTWNTNTSGPGSVGQLISGTGPGGNAITWSNGSSLGINVDTDPGDLLNANGGITYSGNIGNFNGSNNNVGFMKRGFGVLTLSGTNNNFSGQLKVNDDGGTLRLTTQLPNAGQSMTGTGVTPTVYIGGATGAINTTGSVDAAHTQPVGTVLKILTNNALPSNSVINFGSGPNNTVVAGTTFSGINATLRMYDGTPPAPGSIPAGSQISQTVAGVSGGNGLLEAGAGTLTVNVQSSSTTYTGTASLLTDGDGTWQGDSFDSNGVKQGMHGVVVKSGPGRQDFTQFDGSFVGEFDLQAGTVGLGDGQVFGGISGAGTDSTHSLLTIEGGTLFNTGGTLNLRVPWVVVKGSFGVDGVSGAGNLQLEGLSTGSVVFLQSDPTITVTNNGGSFIMLGQVDDGNNTKYNSTTFHGFIKSGAGILTLGSYLNSYRGNTTISQGNVRLATQASGSVPTLGDQGQATPGTLTLAGGTLDMSAVQGTLFAPALGINNFSPYFNTRTNIENNPIVVNGGGTIDCVQGTATDSSDIDFVFNTNSVQWNSGTLTFQNNSNSTSATFNTIFTGSGFNYGGPVVVTNNTVSATAVLEFANTSGTQTWSGNITGTGSIHRATGGTTILGGAANSLGGVTVDNSSLLRMAQSTNHDHVMKTAALSIGTSSSQLDLTNNNLIVTSTTGNLTPVGSWNGTAYSGVTGLIVSGQGTITGGQPAWNGSGIVTSMTQATTSTLTTLAVASGHDIKGITGTQTASFAGQTVHANDALVMYTFAGDANLDGKVNADDYFQIDSNYNKNGNNAAISFHDGDFNYDGKIDGADYFQIDQAFADQGSIALSSPLGGGLAGVSAVPEPASIMGLVAMGAAAGLRRRRRVR